MFSQFIGQIATGFAAIGALSSGETLTGQNFNQNLQRGTQVFTDNALLVQGSFEIMNNAAAAAGRSLVKNEALTAEGASKFLTAKGFANLAETGTINPNSIKFSQGSISGSFKNGGDIANLAAGLKDGTISPSSIPAIRIVVKDEMVFTLDNRRLHAFQQAGIPIPYQKLEKIPQNEIFKFKDYTSGKTDGTSIRVRGQ